ncbi:hypothetical protein AKJ51_05135 [candidate division MSBL1 archaeon SCGC-AAA382A20]|uniref:Uncharacterized protein n=1 Tax=candidate division MSBL1 archaeon SCGC-AAA382A20 TaxID=1698280 RepID=A0A133VFW1_9EURY|nr:hypothetical protein AKJ51_05135 [candidate division MSBL1 archaeon SCGC-AAA382A20]
MESGTVKKIAEHENVWGIKCSHDPAYVRELHDFFEGDDNFHVISAQVDLMDVFYRYGIKRHLDGIFCLFPEWIGELKECIDRDDWRSAASIQKRITPCRNKYIELGDSSAFTYCMNRLGYEGDFTPDYSDLDPKTEKSAEKLLTKYDFV